MKSIGTKIKELEKNPPQTTNINRHKKNQENTTKKNKIGFYMRMWDFGLDLFRLPVAVFLKQFNTWYICLIRK